jgi:hypothetical protein
MNEFILHIVFALVGFLIHVLTKWNNALRKPGYSIKIFWKMNWMSYAISFLCTGLLLGIALAQTAITISFTESALFGLAGASILKNLLKRKET